MFPRKIGYNVVYNGCFFATTFARGNGNLISGNTVQRKRFYGSFHSAKAADAIVHKYNGASVHLGKAAAGNFLGQGAFIKQFFHQPEYGAKY